MGNNRLLRKIALNHNFLWFAIFLSITIWIIDGFFLAEQGNNVISSGLWFDSLIENLPSIISINISLIMYGLSLIMFLSLVNKGNILPFKAHLTGAIFCLFAAVIFFLHPFQVTTILLPLYIVSLNNLFSTFKNKNSKKKILKISIYIGIGSIIFPWFALLLPIFYIGTGFLGSFSIRSFLAGIIGFTLPFWILYGAGVILENRDIWSSVIDNFYTFQTISLSEIAPFQWGSLALIGIPGLLGIVRFVFLGKEKQSSRGSMNALLFFDLVLTTSVFLFPAYINIIIGLKLISCSIFNAYLWSSSESRFNHFLFWIEIIGFICLILLYFFDTK